MRERRELGGVGSEQDLLERVDEIVGEMRGHVDVGCGVHALLLVGKVLLDFRDGALGRLDEVHGFHGRHGLHAAQGAGRGVCVDASITLPSEGQRADMHMGFTCLRISRFSTKETPSSRISSVRTAQLSSFTEAASCVFC